MWHGGPATNKDSSTGLVSVRDKIQLEKLTQLLPVPEEGEGGDQMPEEGGGGDQMEEG
jgi:hypothetical protein